jgi:hypothetical protein
MTSRLARLAALALTACALDAAVVRAQNTVPGSSGNAPPRTVGTSSARTVGTKSLDSVEGTTRSLDAAESGSGSGTNSLDAVDTGSTNDPDAVPAASEAAPPDADTAPLRMGNPERPYANPAPKPATPPVPAPKQPAHVEPVGQWADWEQRLDEGSQRLGTARARAEQAEAAVTSMLARHYPAGEAKAKLLKEREDARADLARAQQEYPELLDEARRDGVPDSVLAPFEAKAPQS